MQKYQEPALLYRVVCLNAHCGERELPVVIGACQTQDDAEDLASGQLAEWNVAVVEKWTPAPEAGKDAGRWKCVWMDYYADIQPHMDGLVARFPESVRQYYTSQQQRMVETEGAE